MERRLRNDDWSLLQTGRGTSLTPSLDISRQTLCQIIESEVNPGECTATEGFTREGLIVSSSQERTSRTRTGREIESKLERTVSKETGKTCVLSLR